MSQTVLGHPGLGAKCAMKLCGMSLGTLAACALLGGIAQPVPAIPFDSVAGTATRTVRVDATGAGDYTSLSAAAIAFNSVVGGINSPWRLEIATNLTEPSAVGFVNSFGAEGALVIRPAASTTPTVQFTSTAGVNANMIFGYLVLGSTSNQSLATLQNTIASDSRYRIEGSNSLFTQTRDLTLRVGAPDASLATSNNALLRIAGDTDGVIIENCNLEIYDTAGVYYAIGLAGMQLAGNSLVPDNCIIRNNRIVANGTGNSGSAINTSLKALSDPVPAGVSFKNLIIDDNEIIANHRGVALNGVSSGAVRGNIIRIQGTTNPGFSGGILFFNSNEVNNFTQYFDRNDIVVSNGGNFVAGIMVTDLSLKSGGSFRVTNNKISTRLVERITPSDSMLAGFYLDNPRASFELEHNSVLLKDSDLTGATAGKFGALLCTQGQTSGTTLRVANNILVCRESDFAAPVVELASASNVAFVDNNLVGAGPIGRISSVVHTTVQNWRNNSGVDTRAQSFDPMILYPAWADSLEFDAAYPYIARVTASTTLFDFHSQSRPATGAYPGAQEPPAWTGSTPSPTYTEFPTASPSPSATETLYTPSPTASPSPSATLSPTVTLSPTITSSPTPVETFYAIGNVILVEADQPVLAVDQNGDDSLDCQDLLWLLAR